MENKFVELKMKESRKSKEKTDVKAVWCSNLSNMRAESRGRVVSSFCGAKRKTSSYIHKREKEKQENKKAFCVFSRNETE